MIAPEQPILAEYAKVARWHGPASILNGKSARPGIPFTAKPSRERLRAVGSERAPVPIPHVPATAGY